MPAGVAYVTDSEEHCFFVKGTLTDLALGIFESGAGKGVGGGWYGPGLSLRERLRVGV